MHAHDLVGPLGSLGDEADGDGRGVGSEDGVRRLALDIADDGVLDGEVLEHGLDHYVGVPHAAVVGGAGDQSQGLVALARPQPLAPDPLVEDPGDLPQPASQRGIVLVLQPHRDPGLRRHVRDAGSHQAGAEHRDLLHVARLHRGLVDAGVLLQRLRGEEDLHQAAGDVARDQLAEEVRLRAVAFLRSFLDADADGLQRPLRRRVVSVGLRQQRLARLLEEDLPAHWIVLQRDLLQDLRAEQLRQLQLDLVSLDAQLAFGQLAGAAARHLHQDRPGHHVVHQAELAPLRRPHGLPGEDQVDGLRDADQRRQPLRSAAARDEPELHLGLSELRLAVVGSDPVRARQRQLEPAAQRRAVDGDHHRLALAQVLEALQRLLRAARQRRRLGGVLRPRQHLHVGADDETVRLGGGEHHALDRGILGEPAEDLVEVLLEAVAQGVHPLAGHVVEDERDAVGARLRAKGAHLGPLQDAGRAEAARGADRNQRGVLALLVQLAQRLVHEPCSGGGEGMAEGDASAARIQLLVGDVADGLCAAEVLLGELLRAPRH